MIRSIADAASGSGPLQYLLDRTGQAVGPSSLDASTDLDGELADFQLPEQVRKNLEAPFQQLGFALTTGTLNLEAHLAHPPSYTAARRDELELALIQLPEFLFGPTTLTSVLIGNVIGFVVREGTRLHLFAADQDEPTEFLVKAMSSWVVRDVTAVFHPWGTLKEFEAAPDRAAWVQQVFEVSTHGNGAGPVAPPGGVAASVGVFSPEHRKALHEALKTAFPSYDELEVMLRLHVNAVQLADIVPPAPLGVAVFKVLQAAEAQGWLPALIHGAREANPGNPQLQAVAAAIPAAVGGEGP
jgi:hypothetical protein